MSFEQAGPESDVPFNVEQKPIESAVIEEVMGAKQEQIAEMSSEAGAAKKESLGVMQKISRDIGETAKSSSVLRNIVTSSWFLPAVTVIAGLSTFFLRSEFNNLSSQADAIALAQDNFENDGGIFELFDDPVYGDHQKGYYLSMTGMKEIYEKAQLMKDASVGSAVVGLLAGSGALARRFMKKPQGK